MSDLPVASRAPRYAIISLLALSLVAGATRLWSSPATALSAPIPGNRLALPAGARQLGPLPSRFPLHLIVGLKPRHADLLDAYTRLRGDRTSVLAHRALTPAQFATLFSPGIADVNAVSAYLTAHGLRIMRVYPDRLLLDVDGTAGQAAAAFDTPLVRYRNRQGNIYFANAAAPRLPVSLAGLVSVVVGLRDDAEPRHRLLPRLARPRPWPRGRTPRAPQLPPSSQLTPAEIAGAYDITPAYSGVFTTTTGVSVTASITGLGQTVAVYELSPYNPADVAAYDSVFGIAATPPLSVAVDGGATDTFGGLGTAEAAMDVELVQAVAPGAQILVYNGPASPTSTDNRGADDTYAHIINDGRAQVLSTSWGQCEPDQLADTPPDMTLLHNLFAQAVAEGMTVVAASGDSGANDCTDGRTNPSVDYPASDPNVLAVGGTTLSLNANGNVTGETSWSGSGGGVSAVYPRPAWQTGVCLPGRTMRAVPDVSLNAGMSYAIWVAGGWTPVNGTSAATPVWAALLALANQAKGVAAATEGTPTPAAGTVSPGLGNVLPEIYQLGPTSVFHDVTTGAGNGVATPRPGWDAVTGWGVPDAYALLRALIAPPAPAPSATPCPSMTSGPGPSVTAFAGVTTTVTATSTILGGSKQPSATSTPAPTRTPQPVRRNPLSVHTVPASVHSGGLLLLQLRGAPGPRQTVIFELLYPGNRSQRILRMTDMHGTTALRLHVLQVTAKGHPLVVRLSATVRNGRHMLIGWTSFRIVPASSIVATSGPSRPKASATPQPRRWIRHVPE